MTEKAKNKAKRALMDADARSGKSIPGARQKARAERRLAKRMHSRAERRIGKIQSSESED